MAAPRGTPLCDPHGRRQAQPRHRSYSAGVHSCVWWQMCNHYRGTIWAVHCVFGKNASQPRRHNSCGQVVHVCNSDAHLKSHMDSSADVQVAQADDGMDVDPADFMASMFGDPVAPKPSLMDELLAMGAGARRASQTISERSAQQEKNLRRVKRRSRELEQDTFGCLLSENQNIRAGADLRAHMSPKHTNPHVWPRSLSVSYRWQCSRASTRTTADRSMRRSFRLRSARWARQRRWKARQHHTSVPAHSTHTLRPRPFRPLTPLVPHSIRMQEDDQEGQR